jgi:YHS domain-containing protein
MKSTPLKKPVVDPVCGMAVNPETTNIKACIGGQNYYFCAEGCRTAFEKNPEKFMGPGCAKPKGLWGRYIARLQKATSGKPMKCH